MAYEERKPGTGVLLTNIKKAEVKAQIGRES
jgi:hypothetical protein